MNGLRRFLLTTAGMIIFLHSVSIYAVPVSLQDNSQSVEMTEESPEVITKLYTYDAVVPAIQYVHPLGWHYLGEVVVITEQVFHDLTPIIVCQNGYLETLFPRIISPNAP